MTDEEWPFPWRKPNGVYDTDGPADATIVHLIGADYLVEPTGSFGITTLRDKFRVSCVTCDEVIHSNTTGPSSRILQHHEDHHEPRR